jgi:hypothetical protein
MTKYYNLYTIRNFIDFRRNGFNYANALYKDKDYPKLVKSLKNKERHLFLFSGDKGYRIKINENNAYETSYDICEIEKEKEAEKILLSIAYHWNKSIIELNKIRQNFNKEYRKIKSYPIV